MNPSSSMRSVLVSLTRCPMSSPSVTCPPPSWVTSPVDLGQLATTFPWDASSVLIRGVLLVTGSQVHQGPNRVGDPTIHDGPDWVGNPMIPIFRRWPGVGESAGRYSAGVRGVAVPRFLDGLLSHLSSGRHYIVLPRARAVFLRRALSSWFL